MSVDEITHMKALARGMSHNGMSLDRMTDVKGMGQQMRRDKVRGKSRYMLCRMRKFFFYHIGFKHIILNIFYRKHLLTSISSLSSYSTPSSN